MLLGSMQASHISLLVASASIDMKERPLCGTGILQIECVIKFSIQNLVTASYYTVT